MKSVRTKIGDVFAVQVGNGLKKYFQYIANDRSQLNAEVIRVFVKSYPVEAEPDLLTVVVDEVEFHAHVMIVLGIKMGLWVKAGHTTKIADGDVLFRTTDEIGFGPGSVPVNVSDDWWTWRINEKPRRVGRLEGEDRKAEIGMVISPVHIVDRMKTGKYHFVYPGFE